MDSSRVTGEAARTLRSLLRPDVTATYPVFVGGEGVELIDDAGRRYLDAAAGVGVACLGYSADAVAAAMYSQATTLQYVHALRFETPILQRLAEDVARVTPADLDLVFFVSGGSEANETAFKFVRQYWLERGRPGKWRIIGRRPSFHGNTLGTLAAGWHVGRRARHAPLLLPFAHTETPNQYRGCRLCAEGGGRCTLACADDLERVIQEAGSESVAAFIAEPVVGAAGGALVPPGGYFRRVRSICDRHDVLMIADEVITGFGRLGAWFGIERFGTVPDLVVFAKGISGGYAPLGGMAVRTALLEGFLAGSKRFEHNFTMAGHAVACSAGVATIEILQRERLVDRVAALEDMFFTALRRELADVAIVGDIRGMGLLAGVELVADRTTKRPFPPEQGVAALATGRARDTALIVYPATGGINGSAAGDYLLLMPPFVTSEADLEEMARRLGVALRQVTDDVSVSQSRQ